MRVTVEDVMTRDVITVGPETPIHKAARLMVDHGVSGLPVVDDQGNLVGIISEGDLILRQKPREARRWWSTFFDDAESLARQYQKATGTTVGEVMTRAVLSLNPCFGIEMAAAIMDNRHIRRLPVVRDGALVGIVSRGDLVKAIAAWEPRACVRSDAELVTELRARMATEPWASTFRVVANASDGVISLWGYVISDAERSALATMARAIDGCHRVENHLLVPGEREQSAT